MRLQMMQDQSICMMRRQQQVLLLSYCMDLDLIHTKTNNGRKKRGNEEQTQTDICLADMSTDDHFM